jgi:hypothetical protein
MVHNMLASVQMLDLTHGLESAPIPVHAWNEQLLWLTHFFLKTWKDRLDERILD